MNRMNSEEHLQILNEACLFDYEAVKFLLKIGKIFRALDDCWDKDHGVVTEIVLDDCFSDLAFGLSSNSFFRSHRDVLEAQIFISWNAWQDSNVWKGHENKIKGACAWFIRDYCNELVPLCAFLIGGKDHARKISLKVRESYLRELEDGGLDGFIR